MKHLLWLIVLCLPAFAQIRPSSNVTANRIIRGSGAPSVGCSATNDVGKVYVNYTAAGTFSTFYVCANTGVATFAWELGGGGGGGGGFVFTGALASIPATCTIGTIAFITDAAVGRNQYNCTSTNVWSQSSQAVAVGSGISIATDPTTGIQTASTDPTIVPRYFTGSGAPSSNCTTGRDFYTDTSGLDVYFCDATNTWKKANGTGVSWFAGSITAPVPGNWSAFGSGCTNSTVTGVGGGNALQIIGTSGSINTCGYSVTISAGDFSKTFVVYALVASVDSSEAGVGFTDGTKAEYCALSAGVNGVHVINDISENTLGGSGIGAATGTTGLGANYNNPAFFRLSRTGTALKCSWSPDGQNFYTIFNDTSPFLAASSLIVVTDSRGGGKASTLLLESYQ